MRTPSEAVRRRLPLRANAPTTFQELTWIAPKGCATLESERTQIQGIARLLHLGASKDLRIRSVHVISGKEGAVSKPVENPEKFVLGICEAVRVVVENTGETHAQWAEALFEIRDESSAALLSAGKNAVRDPWCAIAAGATCSFSMTAPYIFRADRFIVSTTGRHEDLNITDIRVGKNSQFACASDVSATHFREECDLRVSSFDTCQQGQNLAIHISNISHLPMMVFAEVEGSAIVDKPESGLS